MKDLFERLSNVQSEILLHEIELNSAKIEQDKIKYDIYKHIENDIKNNGNYKQLVYNYGVRKNHGLDFDMTCEYELKNAIIDYIEDIYCISMKVFRKGVK